MSKDIDNLLSQLDRKYGKGTVRKANEFPPVDFIECDIPLINNALTGGIPRGRMVQVFGPPKGGKTSFASLFVGAEQRYQAQQEVPKAQIYFDLENTYNIPWTTKLGVDNEKLRLIRHGGIDNRGNPVSLTAEDVVNMTWDLAESGLVSLIVWDSLPSMTPKALLEKHDASRLPVGMLAALMSYHLPELVKVLSRNDCSLIVINQIREKIGVMFGNPQTTPGGNAVEHYASQNINIRQGDFYEAKWTDPVTGEVIDKRRIGNDCRVRVDKNKVGAPYGECTFAFMYDKGVDLEQSIADLALTLRIIEQRGRFYYYPDECLTMESSENVNLEKGYSDGKERLYNAVREHRELYEYLKKACETQLKEGN